MHTAEVPERFCRIGRKIREIREMQIERLQLHCFKSHGEADLAFSPHINLLLGANGMGKTNVLDAIHYLCLTKSYFHATDALNITHDAPGMLIRGEFLRDGIRETVTCGVQRGEKKVLRRNDKSYTRLADHIGRYPAVMLAPDDSAMIHEGSEVRRKWLDAVISQFDRAYLDAVLGYNRALLQRNVLLRQFGEQRFFEPELLEMWDQKLAPLGEQIGQQRRVFLQDFAPAFSAAYREVSGEGEEPGWTYRTTLGDAGNSFADQLRMSVEEDRRQRRTTVGIHRDDLVWQLGGHAIKRYGSQGQQKTFLVALRLAQRAYIHRLTQQAPILLLDDIFDKLDGRRVAALMQRVADAEAGQVFITDTDPNRVSALLVGLGVEVRAYLLGRDGIAECSVSK